MNTQNAGVRLSARRRFPRRHARGFTLIELLVVIAIISILAGIVVPKVAKAITKAKGAAALTEIKGIELALHTMLADSGRSNFNQFFSPGVEVLDPDLMASDPAKAWQEAVAQYTTVFYTLLRQGRDADLDEIDDEVLGKLSDTYMDLPRDPFDNQYQFCPGPWKISTVPIVFRSWRDSGVEDDTTGEYEAYVYDGDAKTVADLDLPGNPPADDRDGFPAPKKQVTMYIWSNGDNLECDQLFGELYGQLGDDYKGGGDDVNNWDPERGFERFY